MFIIHCTATAQQFSIYQNISTSNSLPSNYVLSVCEDENGFLWVGTDKGLCRYNGFSWQVFDKDDGLPGNYINYLYADKRGGLWMDVGGVGYYYYNIASGRTRKMLDGYSVNGDGLFFEKVSAEDGLHERYFITNGKLSPPQKMVSYIPDTSLHWYFDIHSKKINSVIKTGSDSVIQRRLYKSGWKMEFRMLPVNERLNRVYLSNDTILITKTHFYKYAKKGKLLQSYSLFDTQNTYAFSCITKKGIYISNNRTGYYFIGNNGDIKFYNSESGLGSDYVNQVYEMQDGTVMFATLGAGLQFIKNNYKKSYSTNNKIVRTIQKSGDNWYVLAADKVFRINNLTATVNDIGTVATSAFCLLKVNETILIGSLRGIDFYKEEKYLLPSHFFPFNAGISSILKDKNSFIISTYGNGLISLTDKNPEYMPLSQDMKIIERMLPLKNGYARLSYEDGLIISDTVNHTSTHLTQKNGLISNSIHNIYEDHDTSWICTKGGINIFTKGKIAQTNSYNSGFLGSTALYCFKDDNQQLWVVSDKYLHTYNDGKLKAITSHPLVSDDADLIYTAAYDKSTNVLAIGSEKSISFVTLDDIHPDNIVIPPRLLQITVDGELQKSASPSVPYQFEDINFALAPFASSLFSKGALYYNLHGRDNIWREVEDSLKLSFSALRPGVYKLLTKTKNADGNESEIMKLSTFTVEKPFWQQWPFIVFCIAAIAAATTFFVTQLEKQKRKKEDARLFLQQSLQYERERISKDLHDHLGSNLATIIAQTDNIEARLFTGDLESASITVQHLSLQTRETMNVLRETIWSVQESEHTLNEFIIRIRTFLQRLFESTNIRWEVIKSAEENILLSPTQTLHLFRIIQEASQNILKHSAAAEAFYQFYSSAENLIVMIKDNGCGFILEAPAESNGLINMKERVNVLHGTIQIEGNGGVTIQIKLPL